MNKILFFAALMLFVTISGPMNGQILSVTPDTVEQGQRLDIEITTSTIDFTQGTNTIILKQGSTELSMSDKVVNGPNSITVNHAFNSDNPVGSYDLVIRSTSTLTKENAIFIKPDRSKASLDSISPDTGKQGQLVSILLYGTNTNFNKDGAINSVYLSKDNRNIYATSVNPNDSVTLQATFSFSYDNPLGKYSVNVYNDLDGTITIPDGFILSAGSNAPAITSVIPDTVEQGQKLDIEITAENVDFTQGTNTIRLKHGNTEIYLFNRVVNSPNSITVNQAFNSDNPVGSYDLLIWGSTILTKENAIFIKPDPSKASLDSINPDAAKQGQSVYILLHATNTNFNKSGAINSVYLNMDYKKIYAITINTIDSVTLEAMFSFTYAHTVGTYSVNVYNDFDGTITIPNGFKLSGGNSTPSVLTVDPDTVNQEEALEIQVTAENIDFTQGTNFIYFKHENTELYMPLGTPTSPTSLNIHYTFGSNTPLGYYDLSISNTESGIRITKPNALYLKSGILTDLSYISRDGELYYPNPANSCLYFKNKYQMVELYDLNGHKILESKQSDILNISELQKGIYIIKLKMGNEFLVSKLIVQ
jgi:hypothetical protein